MATDTLDESIEQVAQGVGYAASCTGISLGCYVNWLDQHANAVLALCGIGSLLIAIAGFGVSWYYKHRNSK